jgi:predicted 2-oxoglutarate/Fe(II)-dependent dioxygenase YbiX
MMSFNVKDYLRVYEGIFDPSFCNQVVEELQPSNWHTHSFYDEQNKKAVMHSNEFQMTHEKGIHRQQIQDGLWNVIDKYLRHDINNETYSNWNGYSAVRFNKYETGTEMHEHCDHIHTMFDGTRRGIPILSILGALNDDYEGGELIFWGDQKIHLPAGAVMVFPSNFMYPHKVKLVTKGTRYSYVSWVW